MITCRTTALFVCLLSGSSAAHARLTMNLAAAAAAFPAEVGTVVTWTAAVEGSNNVLYRFRSRPAHTEQWTEIIDFSRSNTYVWAANDHEGWYEVEAAAIDLDSRDMVERSRYYLVQSRLRRGSAVVNPTAHPLVLLYSAQGCQEGSQMRVVYRSGHALPESTPWRDCTPDLSMNFLVGGLRAGSSYSLAHVVRDAGGHAEESSPLVSTLPQVETPLPSQWVNTGTGSERSPGVVLKSSLFGARIVASDMEGAVLWYYPDTLGSLTRPSGGGRFFAVAQAPGDTYRQIVREFDLTGRTLLETSAARINEQLAALGKRTISGFHHEARRLPGSRILVLGGVEQLLPDVQGPGLVNIMGDMMIVLDRDLQVLWTWDTFDHLDVTRAAILGEKCSMGGCTRTYLDTDANDWTHANSVDLTPDGNLLISLRHQDWVVKVRYDNGSGSGEVIWRLGKDGDFTFLSDDPWPWFSHQHDANFIDPARLLVFDNANTLHARDGLANSRGQLLVLDEDVRTARLELNVDLGVYSLALGSAQRLPDGNFHFGVGWTPDRNTSLAVEVDSAGQVVYQMESNAIAYRSFRLTDLYAK